MLSYSFSNMSAAKKAKEALKAFGFNHVTLDANDSFHSDTEFAFDHGLTAGSLTGSVYGTNYYAFNPEKLALTVADPNVSGMSSSDHKEFKTKLIVDEGEGGDAQLVDRIVSEYISLS